MGGEGSGGTGVGGNDSCDVKVVMVLARVVDVMIVMGWWWVNVGVLLRYMVGGFVLKQQCVNLIEF